MGDVIEPAPSGRSKCRGCQRKIDKGELRYGEAVPNAFGAGDALHWYHPRCGAERLSEGNVTTWRLPQTVERRKVDLIKVAGLLAAFLGGILWLSIRAGL